ncbi:MAG: hypothetical protein P1U64_02420 [Alcanivoracaceae bacterium]|nr:hypothetical protein [Alcanivoracaceae bacterium]
MTGTLVMAAALAAVVLALAGWRRRTLLQRRVLTMLALVVALLPWPFGAAHWLEGLLSQLSITSGLLAVIMLMRANGMPSVMPDDQRRMLCVVVLLVAPWFYPLSLGAAALDPYAWGFGDFRFSTALLLLGLAAWVSRAYALCLILVLGQVAFHFRLLHSDNLWDYLLDPALVVYALVTVVRRPAPAPSAGETGARG